MQCAVLAKMKLALPAASKTLSHSIIYIEICIHPPFHKLHMKLISLIYNTTPVHYSLI